MKPKYYFHKIMPPRLNLDDPQVMDTDSPYARDYRDFKIKLLKITLYLAMLLGLLLWCIYQLLPFIITEFKVTFP